MFVSCLGIALGAQRYEHLAIVSLIVDRFTLGCELTSALVGTRILALKRSNAQVLANEAAVLALECTAVPCMSAILGAAA